MAQYDVRRLVFRWLFCVVAASASLFIARPDARANCLEHASFKGSKVIDVYVSIGAGKQLDENNIGMPQDMAIRYVQSALQRWNNSSAALPQFRYRGTTALRVPNAITIESAPFPHMFDFWERAHFSAGESPENGPFQEQWTRTYHISIRQSPFELPHQADLRGFGYFYDFEYLVFHELGHALGLGHSRNALDGITSVGNHPWAEDENCPLGTGPDGIPHGETIAAMQNGGDIVDETWLPDADNIGPFEIRGPRRYPQRDDLEGLALIYWGVNSGNGSGCAPNGVELGGNACRCSATNRWCEDDFQAQCVRAQKPATLRPGGCPANVFGTCFTNRMSYNDVTGGPGGTNPWLCQYAKLPGYPVQYWESDDPESGFEQTRNFIPDLEGTSGDTAKTILPLSAVSVGNGTQDLEGQSVAMVSERRYVTEFEIKRDPDTDEDKWCENDEVDSRVWPDEFGGKTYRAPAVAFGGGRVVVAWVAGEQFTSFDSTIRVASRDTFSNEWDVLPPIPARAVRRVGLAYDGRHEQFVLTYVDRRSRAIVQAITYTFPDLDGKVHPRKILTGFPVHDLGDPTCYNGPNEDATRCTIPFVNTQDQFFVSPFEPWPYDALFPPGPRLGWVTGTFTDRFIWNDPREFVNVRIDSEDNEFSLSRGDLARLVSSGLDGPRFWGVFGRPSGGSPSGVQYRQYFVDSTNQGVDDSVQAAPLPPEEFGQFHGRPFWNATIGSSAPDGDARYRVFRATDKLQNPPPANDTECCKAGDCPNEVWEGCGYDPNDSDGFGDLGCRCREQEDAIQWDDLLLDGFFSDGPGSYILAAGGEPGHYCDDDSANEGNPVVCGVEDHFGSDKPLCKECNVDTMYGCSCEHDHECDDFSGEDHLKCWGSSDDGWKNAISGTCLPNDNTPEGRDELEAIPWFCLDNCSSISPWQDNGYRCLYDQFLDDYTDPGFPHAACINSQTACTVDNVAMEGICEESGRRCDPDDDCIDECKETVHCQPMGFPDHYVCDAEGDIKFAPGHCVPAGCGGGKDPFGYCWLFR